MSCLSAARIERFLASLADTWLIAIRTAIASVSAGLLLRVLFIACLQSGASVFVLLTLPTGGGQTVLTKEKEEFQKKALATMIGSRSRRLEPVREFPSQLLLGLLQAGQECCALDADDVGDGLVREAFLPEFADAACFRHELVQTMKKLGEHHLIGEDLLDERSVVRHVVAESAFAVRQRIVKRDGRVVAEFAVEAVAVAQPPFAARAEAFAAILHAFPQRRAPAVVLAILVLRDLVPLLGGLVVDAILLGFFCHEFFLL
nr:MAG TPA: hypothetical protein [Caudoviricetes sp.]